jgi:alpha-amylase/alpha-mannosidase (GH57 family)
MSRYVCIHGHFYQPPRENPWLEYLSQQDSATPYHDWNQRITAECYAPNSSARIHDQSDQIVDIVNNYRDISFNFGPTLMSWFQDIKHLVHGDIVSADRLSIDLLGHGSAMAQVYNHLIMPLANRRDKQTQITWGIADFERRFGRFPDGMWLAETAVDLETLDLMAQAGIKFTVLSPFQAKSVRKTSDAAWQDVSGGRIDPKQPYRVALPEGREIAIFFYDAPVSQAVAFERLLSSGETFAGRLLSAFDGRVDDQLVHIATDGETYGHHHRFGEMALAYAIRYIEAQGLAKVTNYAAYLATHPPTWEAQIFDNSAWSCSHGVGRWSEDCGCKMRADWHQRWRKPLRETLNWLRDELTDRYQSEAGELLRDPWAAREDYIQVILDRSEESRTAFLEKHANRTLDSEQRIRCWKLLEVQRNSLLMFTSCGWFFDDISGLEGAQVLSYAGRTVQLAHDLFGVDLENELIQRLSEAPSNVAAQRNGGFVYETQIKPMQIDLREVAANAAIVSIFKAVEATEQFYCYRIERLAATAWRHHQLSLVTGQIRVTSTITEESATFTYMAYHQGDHNISCAVSEKIDPNAYAELQQRLQDCGAQDLPSILAIGDQFFGPHRYGLKEVFQDEQRAILNLVLESSVQKMEDAIGQLNKEYSPVLALYADLHAPLPRVMKEAAAFSTHRQIRQLLKADWANVGLIRNLFEQAERNGLALDEERLEYALRDLLKRDARKLPDSPEDLELISRLRHNCGLLRVTPLKVSLWTVQNKLFWVMKNWVSVMERRASQGSAHAQQWLQETRALAEILRIRWPEAD